MADPAAKGENALERGPEYLWHHELHRRIANEQLAFILAAFDPSYSRVKTTPAVKTALEGLGVRSYAFWELIGEHDLMLQLWLPSGVTVHKAREAIAAAVPAAQVDMLVMVVESYDSHWMWPEQLDFARAERVIDASDYVELNGPQSRKIPRARIQRYLTESYVHTAPRSRTIKFFIRVTSPRGPTTVQEQDAIRDQARLAAAKVRQAALMRVHGDNNSYLLTGRVLRKDFLDIAGAVGDVLGQSSVLEFMGCRTTTHISARYGALDRREQLLPDLLVDSALEPTEADVRSWLNRPETDDLEFKASAFTDVDAAIGKRAAGRTLDQQVNEVAKAVCGILNTEGGTVIIGVAEMGETGVYSADELRSRYGEVPQIGAKGIVGVDDEVRTQRRGWDSYDRKLRDKLVTLLPDSGGWWSFHPVTIEGRTVAVIRIQRPSEFFYIVEPGQGRRLETFYGRMGGQTRALSGKAMDRFKEAHPRTIRGSGE